MNGSPPINSSSPTSNLQWQKIEGKTTENTEQAASLIFQNKQQQTVIFNSERRLVIVLLGNKESTQKASTHLEAVCGIPSLSIDTDDVLKEIEKEDGLAHSVIKYMQASELTDYPEEFTIGQLSKEMTKPSYSTGLILKGVPTKELPLDPFLNPPHLRKADTLIIYSLESTEQKDSETLVNRLEREKRELKKINPNDPSSIDSQINAVFNETLQEIANKQPQDSTLFTVIKYVAVAAISFAVGKHFFTNAKDH